MTRARLGAPTGRRHAPPRAAAAAADRDRQLVPSSASRTSQHSATHSSHGATPPRPSSFSTCRSRAIAIESAAHSRRESSHCQIRIMNRQLAANRASATESRRALHAIPTYARVPCGRRTVPSSTTPALHRSLHDFYSSDPDDSHRPPTWINPQCARAPHDMAARRPNANPRARIGSVRERHGHRRPRTGRNLDERPHPLRLGAQHSSMSARS